MAGGDPPVRAPTPDQQPPESAAAFRRSPKTEAEATDRGIATTSLRTGLAMTGGFLGPPGTFF